MINKLTAKCETLMAFIPSNLYIHSNKSHEIVDFSRLVIPEFLSHYVEDSIAKLIREKENQNADKRLENPVYLYKDPFRMCYLTWQIADDDSTRRTITLGPLITDRLTVEDVRYLGYQMKLSTDNCFILESFYGVVPYYDQNQLERIASLFLDYLTVEPRRPQMISEDHSVLLPEEAKQVENKFQPFDYVEANYATEAKMLHAIEIGDTAFLKGINKKQSQVSFSMPPRFPNDPLREQKNLSITLNSIAVRAAIKGGLDPTIAHNLSHNFAIQIENQASKDALFQFNIRMMMTYAESVKKYTLKGHSELVTNAVNYIRIHLVEKIGLTDLANYLHVSREHLSRQFKEEMDLTVTDFIHKTKTEESCNLLTSKTYSVSDIAYIFSYSSPAHYAKMFKKHLGVSPKQWQNRQ